MNINLLMKFPKLFSNSVLFLRTKSDHENEVSWKDQKIINVLKTSKVKLNE